MSDALLLDRFVKTRDGGWRDLATGRRVWVRTRLLAGQAHAPVAWDRYLVHPRTTAGWIGLVDCGFEGQYRWVEAYDLHRAPQPWRGPRTAVDRCLAAAVLIGHRCGLEVPPGSRRWVRDVRGVPAFLPVPIRAVSPGDNWFGSREVQDVRHLLDDLERDERQTVVMPPSMDLRQVPLRVLAHHARLRGFVPVSGDWGDRFGGRCGAPPGRVLDLLRHRRILVLRGWRPEPASHPGGQPGHHMSCVAMPAMLAAGRVAQRAGWAGQRDPAAKGEGLCVREAAEAFGAPDGIDAWPAAVAATLEGVASLAGRGRHAEARRRLLAAAAAADRRGDRVASGVLWLMLGRAFRTRGGVHQAEQAVRRAMDAFGRGQAGRGAVACHLELAWLAWEDDRLAESARQAEAALSAARAAGDRRAAGAARWLAAHVACWDRSIDEVRTHLSAFDGFDGHDTLPSVAEAGPSAEGVAYDPLAQWLPSPRTELLARVVRARAGLPGCAEPPDGGCECGDDLGGLVVLDRLAIREATILECAARGDRRGSHDALMLGLREAREGHAPLMALSLRLTAAECEAGRDGRVSQLRRWSGAVLPALYRRRLNALIRPESARAYRAELETRMAMPTPADVIALVQIFNDAVDDRSGLEGACVHVRRRLGVAAVSVFARRTGEAVLLANAGGRPCNGVSAARFVERGAGLQADPADREVFAAIRWGGDVVGVAAARWLAGTPGLAGVAEAYLAALTSAAAGSVRALREDLAPPSAPQGAAAGILGVSRAVEGLRGLVIRAGATSFPVLIEGESGTGKELAAKAVHLASERRGRRFCAVNCAALSEDLLEAELFGHARGAFTGASADRPGLFEEADGGTLFLDEIGELSLRGQAKLLRAIQEREVRRVGENTHRRVDVRIVCATNRPLGDEVVRGRFRQDLFYRLDVVRIHVPPLRERPEDIPLLADRFWRDALGQTGGRAVLSAEAVAVLAGRPWPGNVRELQNTLAALAVQVPKHGRVGPRDLALIWPDLARGRQPARTLGDARRAFEAEFVRSVLKRSGGRRGRAADELGVTRQGLAKLMTRLGITAGPGSAQDGPAA